MAEPTDEGATLRLAFQEARVLLQRHLSAIASLDARSMNLTLLGVGTLGAAATAALAVGSSDATRGTAHSPASPGFALAALGSGMLSMAASVFLALVTISRGGIPVGVGRMDLEQLLAHPPASLAFLRAATGAYLESLKRLAILNGRMSRLFTWARDLLILGLGLSLAGIASLMTRGFAA